MRSVHVVIRGKVQGVWYRAWTEKTARGHGLDGWVRNCADGSVEAVFHGSDDTVTRMLADCRVGPPLARVTDLTVTDCPPPEESGFHIRPS